MRRVVAALVVVAAGAWAGLEYLPVPATASAESRAPAAAVERYTEVKAVAIDGGRGLPLAELHAAIGTEVGSWIDVQQLAADRAAITRELAARGYLAAKVSEAVVTHANGGAYIVFDVERGPLFHLRSVTVTGTTDTMVTIASGDPAVDERLQQARTSLETSLAREGRAAKVELITSHDVAAAAVDVELVTR